MKPKSSGEQLLVDVEIRFSDEPAEGGLQVDPIPVRGAFQYADQTNNNQPTRLGGGSPGCVIDNQRIGLNCNGQGNRLGFAHIDAMNRWRCGDRIYFQPGRRGLNKGSHVFRGIPMT